MCCCVVANKLWQVITNLWSWDWKRPFLTCPWFSVLFHCFPVRCQRRAGHFKGLPWCSCCESRPSFITAVTLCVQESGGSQRVQKTAQATIGKGQSQDSSSVGCALYRLRDRYGLLNLRPFRAFVCLSQNTPSHMVSVPQIYQSIDAVPKQQTPSYSTFFFNHLFFSIQTLYSAQYCIVLLL